MSPSKSAIFILILMAGLAFLPAAAFCRSTAVLTVDRADAFMTDEIILRLTISADDRIINPRIENTEPNFRITSESPAIENFNINGVRLSRYTGVYRLKPQRAGDFTIGPAVFTLGSSTVKSNAVKVLVRSDSRPAPAPKSEVFAEANLMAQSGYPGQKITLRLSLYHSFALPGYINVDLPDVPNLTMNQVGESTDRVIDLSGISYGLTEASFEISSSKPGTYKIPPIKSLVPVGGFRVFGEPDRITIETNPVTLVIKDFPVKDRPSDFGGLVGNFDISASLLPASVKTGEAATLTVSITGRGDKAFLPDLTLNDLPGLKIYPDKSPQKDETGSGKTEKWAVIPKSPGKYSLPSFGISFLNPDTGLYETKRTPPLTLSVEGAAAAAHEISVQDDRPAGKADEDDAHVRDIQTIHENAGDVLISGKKLSPFSVGLILIAPVLFLGISALTRSTLSRNRGTNGNNRVKKAFPAFRKALKDIPEGDTEALFKAFSAYLAARLGRGGGNVTSGEARSLLVSAKVPHDAAANLAGLYSRLEAAVFSRNPGAFTGKDREGLVSAAKFVDKAIGNR